MFDPSSLLSRRNLLLALAGGGATTVALTTQPSGEALSGSISRLFSPVTGRSVALATAMFEDWAAQTGTLFTAETGHVLKLVNVTAFPDRDDRPAYLRDRAFAVRFDIVQGDKLTGDTIYRFAHRQGGTFDMFLTDDDPAHPQRLLGIFN